MNLYGYVNNFELNSLSNTDQEEKRQLLLEDDLTKISDDFLSLILSIDEILIGGLSEDGVRFILRESKRYTKNIEKILNELKR